LQPVGEPSREALHDVLGGLSRAVHQADDAAAGVQRLRQKYRQDRIQHLRRDVGEQARERQEQRVSRQPAETGLLSGHSIHSDSTGRSSALDPDAPALQA